MFDYLYETFKRQHEERVEKVRRQREVQTLLDELESQDIGSGKRKRKRKRR